MAEAAAWLGISKAQCYRLVKAGRIPAADLSRGGRGRCLRISRLWLERWMAHADDFADARAS